MASPAVYRYVESVESFPCHTDEPATQSSPIPVAGGDFPLEWPRKLESPLAWTKDDMVDEKTYICELTVHELMDVEKALGSFKALHRPFYDVTKETFPLDILGPGLESLARTLHSGTGFFVLRGLDPSRFSQEDNISIYLGISSYIGERRAQQHPDGRMLTHITPPAFKMSRSYHPVVSTASLPFHADYANDILALYCLNSGAGGGQNIIASSWRIYNELAQTRPHLLKVLAQDDWTIIPTDRSAEPTTNALLHLNSEGQPILNFSIRNLLYVNSTQRQALEAVQELAVRHKLETRFVAGDIRFVNNLAMLHSRDAFEAGHGSDKRYLLRLWLRNEELGWPIPAGLVPDWETSFEGAQGRERWDLNPMTEDELHKNESSRCG